MKREPIPASVSSTSTPSGVEMRTRSSYSIVSVKLDRFVEERRPGWTGLEELLRDAGAKPERLGPERLRRLGSLYRAAAADLAFARRAFPHDPVTRRLERLVLDGRQAVYADQGARRSVWWFLATGYWRRVLRAAVGARSPRSCCCSRRSRSRRCGRSTTPPRRSAWCPPQFQGAAEPGGRAGRAERGRPGRAVERDLHEQHPRDVPGDRRRHLRRAGHGRGADLQRRLHRRDPRPDGRERLERRASWSSSSRTACSSCRASPSRPRPGCGSAGRWWSPGRSRAASRCGARRARRWRWCSARCRGSCSPGWSRGS